MHIDRVAIGAIPLFIIRGDRIAHDQCVVAYHGANLCKESFIMTPYIQRLIRNGVTLIVPDLPMHGQRTESVPYERHRHRFAVVARVAEEIGQILDHLSIRSCAVSGASLGGLCAFATAVRDIRVRVIAAATTFLSWSSLRKSEAQEMQRILDDLDPANSVERLAQCNILLLLGEKDSWASPSRIVPDVESLRRHARTVGGSVCCEIYTGVGHTLTAGMGERMADWIVRRLHEND